MTTNSYVQNYTQTNEQDLQNDLVVESIQMKGIDMYYLKRTLVDYDYLFGEDPTSAFNQSDTIEMYPVNVDGFGGSGDIISQFGLEIKDTATFVVSKSRFTQETLLDKPQVGDLIFLPLTKSILQINFCEDESPFYELGKQYVWELKTEVFEFSYEDFATGNPEVDSTIAGIVDYDPATDTEEYGDNDELQAESDPLINFDENNPFGAR